MILPTHVAQVPFTVSTHSEPTRTQSLSTQGRVIEADVDMQMMQKSRISTVSQI